MIAAEAEAFGPGAALVVGVEMGRTREETPPIPLLRPPSTGLRTCFDSAQGERNAPPQGMVEAGMGAGKEARAGGRAVAYRSVTTGPMKASVTDGTPKSFSLIRADVGSRAWGLI